MSRSVSPSPEAFDTRRRIVEAVAHIATHEHPTAFSVPAVARRARVSVRTVYRYFPTKEDLLDGLNDFGGPVAARLLDRRHPVSLDDYLDALPELFGSLAENRSTVQVQLTNPVSRDARRRRVEQRRAAIDAGLADELPDLDAADRGALADLITVLGSSFALFDLLDRGHDAAGAADLTAWAVRALVDHAHTTKEVGHGPL